MIEEKLNNRIFDQGDIPDFSKEDGKIPCGTTTGTGNYDFFPYQDTGADLQEATKQAQQQMIQFQQQLTDMTTQERLKNVEDSLKTILNMLKLILGAYLERERQDKEKEKS